MRATARFEVKSWDEKPIEGGEGTARTARARVVLTYRGDVEGESAYEALMAYREDGSADYVGQEHVRATLDGRAGTFVVQFTGTYGDGTARSTWNVVPGSATGALAGLRGEGTSESSAEAQGTVTLDYELD